MGKLARVADINDLSEGGMKKYRVEGIDILIARIEGKYYAVQNKCPHLGGDLSAGKLAGGVVTCPRHGSQFNLTDGSLVSWTGGAGLISSIARTSIVKLIKRPRNLITYKVEVKGQDILVEI